MQEHYIFKDDIGAGMYEILFIENEEVLGKAKINRPSNTKKVYQKAIHITTNRATKEENYQTITYITGYLNVEKVFFPCPIGIHFVELEQAIQFKGNSKNGLDLYLKVYPKEFTFYSKPRSMKLCFKNYGSSRPFESYTDNLINFINEYVYSGHNISDLDEDKLLSLNKLHHDFNLFKVVNLIDKFGIRYFDESMNRVGKDNYFWISYQIDNIYDNSYFRSLIVEVIKDCYHVGSSWNDQTKRLTYSIDQGNAYAPSYAKREITSNEGVNNIKAMLKIGFASKFDFSKFLLEEVKYKNDPVTEPLTTE